MFEIQWGSEYLTSLVFKWLKVVQSPNSLLVRYSDHHLNNGPFGYWTTFDYSNTRLVRYSDTHCISGPGFRQMVVITID